MNMLSKIIKSKKRVADHGEVFTPDFIVNDMLDLVNNETERVDSRFLEPACGDGNFLIEVLRRKLAMVRKRYKKSKFDYEKYSLVAISSIYGVELLDDNVDSAQKRLFDFFVEEYKKDYKNKVDEIFLKNVEYILSRNILQGDALSLKNKKNEPITFSEWSLVSGTKIKRRDFQFLDLAEFDQGIPSLFSISEESDTGETVYSPKPVKEFPAINFIEIYKSYE